MNNLQINVLKVLLETIEDIKPQHILSKVTLKIEKYFEKQNSANLLEKQGYCISELLISEWTDLA